jgi:peptidoglycan/LPS O-acetylase OafA/YrhL
MPKSKRLHFKDIDALRFVAFLPVFLFCVFYLSRTEPEGFHYELTNALSIIKQNSLDFFFFLSAFLLSSHSLREYKYNQSFSLRGFYIRRLIRIMPLFLFGIIFAFLIHPWILNTLKLNTIEAPVYSNYLLLFPNYFSSLTQEQYVYVSILWSIYMFILFYLVWGIVLKYFSSHLKTIAFGAMVIGVVARIIHHYLDFSFEFDPLSFGVPIGFGTVLAVMIRNESPYIERIKVLPRKLLIPFYAAGCLIAALGYLATSNFILNNLVPFVTCSFYSFVIVEQTFGKNSFVKLREYKIFSHLGKISYGLIFYQSIINVLIIIGLESLEFDISSVSVKIAFVMLSFILSWVIADLSYNLLEKPLLRLRREFKKI